MHTLQTSWGFASHRGERSRDSSSDISPHLPASQSCRTYGWPLTPRPGPSTGTLSRPRSPACRSPVPSHLCRSGSQSSPWGAEQNTRGPRDVKAGVRVPAHTPGDCVPGKLISQPGPERFVLVETQEKTKQSTGDNRELPPFKPGGPGTQSVLCTEAPQAGPGCAGQSSPGCFHPQLPPNPQSPP